MYLKQIVTNKFKACLTYQRHVDFYLLICRVLFTPHSFLRCEFITLPLVLFRYKPSNKIWTIFWQD